MDAAGTAAARRLRVGPPMTPDVLVLLNPRARRFPEGEIRAALDRAFQRRGLRHRIFTAPAENARAFARREINAAMDAGCDRVVAVGGDGTVAIAAEALAAANGSAPRAALGIVPTGTANVLARELGIPLGLEEAVELVAEAPRSIEIDAIAIGERRLLTQVGIGPDALMIRDTSRSAQNRFGRLAYVIAYARRALGQGVDRFELTVDGRIVPVRAWQIVIANSGSVATPPFTWGPGIDPTDGVVDVCIFDVRTVWDLFVVTWRVITGRHRRDESTRYLRATREVSIRSRRPRLVQGDGELLGRTPIHLTVAPHALRVIVARAVEPAPTLETQATASAAPGTSVVEDIETMVAQRSRAWVLQGVLRHPLTALAALDAALFLRINALHFGRTFDRAIWWVSRFMHYGEGWAAVALVMLAVEPAQGARATIEALIVLWLTMLTVNLPLKSLFARRRPFLAFVDARVIGPKPLDHSFPSGHSAAAFAGALLFGADAPAWSPFFYAIAVIVSFSRVYLGVHYPSDAFIGAIAGAVFATGYRALLHAIVSILT